MRLVKHPSALECLQAPRDRHVGLVHLDVVGALRISGLGRRRAQQHADAHGTMVLLGGEGEERLLLHPLQLMNSFLTFSGWPVAGVCVLVK